MANRLQTLFQALNIPIRFVDINGDGSEYAISVTLTGGGGGGGSGANATEIQGNAPAGDLPLGNPVRIGAVDSDGNVQNLQMDPGSLGLYVTPISTSSQPFENSASVLLSLAARTATNSTVLQNSSTSRGILLIVSVTSAGSGSITPSIGVLSAISGNYFSIWTANEPITADGDYAYLLYPGTSGGNYTEVVPVGVPRDWRLTVTHNNGSTITYGALAFTMI